MSLLKRIKEGIPEFREQAQIVADTYGGSKKRWLLSMIWCLIRYGARPIDYVRFEFHKKSARERNRYLTIFKYFHYIKHFGAGKSGVKGKLAEYYTFKDFIRRDWMEVNSSTPLPEIEAFIKKYNTVFAKPVDGDQGKGVLQINGIGTPAYHELIKEKRRTIFVLEERIVNCKELSLINPSSLNTVRATTLIEKDGSTRILSIILRVGAPGSHVDNWGAGGVGYNFDINTGVCNMYGKDKKNHPYIYHPGSYIQMIGFKMPHFEELKVYVNKLTKIYPSARYVGWDIAITPEGFDLVEMNCPAGHDMFQSFDNPVYDIMKKNW